VRSDYAFLRFENESDLSFDSVATRELHDETSPHEGAKTAHFCLMKITGDVPKYAVERG
jgi:thiamine biosynthesis protein ThiC